MSKSTDQSSGDDDPVAGGGEASDQVDTLVEAESSDDPLRGKRARDAAAHSEDDSTVILGGLPSGSPVTSGPATAARRAGRTTILPGEKPQNTGPASPGVETKSNDPRQAETAGVDDSRPDYVPGTAQAREVTEIGGANDGLTVQYKAVSEQRIVRDRFVILESLGKGGMGQVFKARDLRREEAEDDDPYVAIKFLGEEFSRHPRALISLQREAKKSQQLAHPNVLTVYDFDRDGDRVYMTMEYLNGAALSGWDSINFLKDCEPTIFSLIEQMSNGLIYAHQHGVVHSDLKPDNVFVTVDGRVKLLDFGIARIMDSALQKDSFDAGELGALTMRYASLEMMAGGEDPLPADDVYALGLLAYQLFAGFHPYEGKNALVALERGIVPKPLKGLKRYQRQAIEKAIQIKREDRTPSAEVFLREFTGSKTRNLALIVAVVVLASTSGYFAYQASQREGPSVPFSQLSATVQQDFNRTLDLGRQSSEIGDWDGASRYYLAAYELHPRNPDAEEGLEAMAQHMVDYAAGIQSPRQKQNLLKVINGYATNEYLANHEGLSALRLSLGDEEKQ